jgi:hypothetical protein
MGVILCKEIKGWETLPDNLRYWTLCNEQPAQPTSEIEQFASDLHFLKKSQFVGVDLDPAIIARNRKAHPDATWFCGDFLDVIRNEEFDPGVVHLDTEATYKTQADLVASTMILCPPGTVLLANLVDGHVYTAERYAATELLESLSRLLPDDELNCWGNDIKTFVYRTNRNYMRTYVLHKESLNVRYSQQD